MSVGSELRCNDFIEFHATSNELRATESQFSIPYNSIWRKFELLKWGRTKVM